jgi:N-acetylmuramoyl-L-alanine amidase
LVPGDHGAAVRELQSMLARYGYGIAATGVFDEATANVVAAFQRHFRPERVDGNADGSTVATLRALAAALPMRPAMTKS